MKQKISEAIRSRREELGLSHTALSIKAGMSLGSAKRIETKGDGYIHTLLILLDTLGLTIKIERK